MRTETITRTLYQFEELSEAAKEKARDWFRQATAGDTFEFDYVIEDAKQVASLMGIEIDKVYWSGFSSQGDGACFEGSYSYKSGAVKAVKAYAPNDQTLARIVSGLYEVQKRHFYKLSATVKQRGHYSHSGCTEIEVFHVDSRYRDIGAAEDEVKELLRDFMNWIYKQLDKQNDWINSNESIDENILANEYEFDVNGRRA